MLFRLRRDATLDQDNMSGDAATTVRIAGYNKSRVSCRSNCHDPNLLTRKAAGKQFEIGLRQDEA